MKIKIRDFEIENKLAKVVKIKKFKCHCLDNCLLVY